MAGYLVSLRAGFWLASLAGLIVLATALLIRPGLINHEVARGLLPGDTGRTRPSGLAVLAPNRPLLMLAVVTLLWQLANGAMLPLTGQKLAIGNTGRGALFQAALIVVAQLVMIPMAVLVARRADRWGRAPLFLAAFPVLPIRGFLAGAIALVHGYDAAMLTLTGIAALAMALLVLTVPETTRPSHSEWSAPSGPLVWNTRHLPRAASYREAACRCCIPA